MRPAEESTSGVVRIRAREFVHAHTDIHTHMHTDTHNRIRTTHQELLDACGVRQRAALATGTLAKHKELTADSHER